MSTASKGHDIYQWSFNEVFITCRRPVGTDDHHKWIALLIWPYYSLDHRTTGPQTHCTVLYCGQCCPRWQSVTWLLLHSSAWPDVWGSPWRQVRWLTYGTPQRAPCRVCHPAALCTPPPRPEVFLEDGLPTREEERAKVGNHFDSLTWPSSMKKRERKPRDCSFFALQCFSGTPCSPLWSPSIKETMWLMHYSISTLSFMSCARQNMTTRAALVSEGHR